MNKDKKKSGRLNSTKEKSEINDLTRKLKDLEDLCAKLKRSNETMKNDYDKHKSRLTKVNLFERVSRARPGREAGRSPAGAICGQK